MVLIKLLTPIVKVTYTTKILMMGIILIGIITTTTATNSIVIGITDSSNLRYLLHPMIFVRVRTKTPMTA